MKVLRIFVKRQRWVYLFIIDMNTLIESLRKELIANSSEAVQKSSQHFFKEEILCYGIKSAKVVDIGKAHFKNLGGASKTEIFGYCDNLWQSGYIEESFIACNWSYNVNKYFEPADFKVFEKWIDVFVNNWASCDTLCNHTVGKFVEMYPEFLKELIRWTQSPNRWMRRAAAVSLIIPARHGKFLNEIFEIADRLLLDREDMVQKGYGWMLKVASQMHQKEVFDYVFSKRAVMPRTALRYAIEKMPSELKTKAMGK